MPRNVAIDGAKLYKKILPVMNDHNFTLSSFSEDLGYSKSFMSNIINKNNINSVTMGLLQAKWGINPDSYVLKSNEKPETNETNPDLIYESVKKGIVDGFDEIKDEIRKLIHDEVYSAVKEVWEDM